MNGDENFRKCRKCLVKDLDDAGLAAEIKRCIEAIKPVQRTEDAKYAQRLAICMACPHLSAGTCLKCGCYVEIRAALKKNGCPDVPDRWKDKSREVV